MKKLFLFCACLLLAVPCQAEIITVDDDGPADFNNIQDAINYSWHGDTVIVRPGTYIENIYFNSRAITLTSENPDDSNIVGSTKISVSSGYTVTFDFGEGLDSVLTGFTLRGRGAYCYASSPTITKNIITYCDTMGIYGEYSSAPTISYNTITNNSSYSSYGVCGCHGLIVGNTLSYNTKGLFDCDGEIRENEIIHNSGTGQGAGLYACDGIISNNTIAWNVATGTNAFGGGLSQCSAIISHNVISDNTAFRGGGLYDCDVEINNNIIIRNIATGSDGGGLYDCSGAIINNTLVENVASIHGGGLYNCSGFVKNNIIAFNAASYAGGIWAACDNSFNNLWMNEGGNFGGGAIVGLGDICQDPLFAEPNNDDYHLQSTFGHWEPNSQTWLQDGVNSPCIDAGDPSSDWTGELWPHGKRINIGAYGGTAEASMTASIPPLSVGNKADLNGDDIVNLQDYAFVAGSYQTEGVLMSEDLNRDNQVNGIDLSIFVGNWLWKE